MNKGMTTSKNQARIAGTFFLLATASAIIGLKLYDPLLTNSEYLIQGAKNPNQIVWGAVMELILVCSAVGTGIMLFPVLKKNNPTMALAYVCFRVLEVFFILLGIISVLSLLSLSQAYNSTDEADLTSFQTIGKTLKAIHNWTFILGPNFMLGINTFIYSYIFYQTTLIPRKISTLGVTGAVSIFIAALLEMFGVFPQISTWGVLLALPVFVYEMTLAIWLIVKGFNENHEYS